MRWSKLGPLYELMVAVQFLTRLPMPRDLDPGPEALGRSAPYFPVVGAIVGGLLGALGWGLWSHTALGPAACAALVCVAGVGLTGAFHEDGLADAADGLWGGWTREDVLRIMRDSRIGSYGACALGLALMVRLVALVEMAPGAWPAALVVAHVVGRTSSLPLIFGLPYARAEDPGQAKPLIEGLGPRRLWAGLVVAGALCAGAAGWVGPAALAWMCGIVGLTGWYYRRRIGGITGDCLGATNVLCELAALVWCAATWPAAGGGC